MIDSLSVAVHAFVRRVSMSFSVDDRPVKGVCVYVCVGGYGIFV